MAKRLKLTLCTMFCVALLLASGLPALAQQPSDPPCRPTAGETYYDLSISCMEVVYDDVQTPEAVPSLMGLAFAPDNTLYMARTAIGEIWAMRDADGDQFMDEPQMVADDLDLPVALTVYEKSLFVLTVQQVIRLDDEDEDGVFESQTVLVDHLSDGQGWWPGSIAIGPDQRLYVTTGASQEPDPRRGALLSFALDGSGEQIEATGLYHPTDFAWHPETGDLWIADNHLPLDLSGTAFPLDELNRFVPGADYSTQPANLLFDPGSSLSGLVFYSREAYPAYQGNLLMALHGTSGLPKLSGYSILTLGFEAGAPTGITVIAPTTHPPYTPLSIEEYSFLGQGIFPEHPADIVVSGEGWIYVGLEEGRILRFRPHPPEE